MKLVNLKYKVNGANNIFTSRVAILYFRERSPKCDRQTFTKQTRRALEPTHHPQLLQNTIILILLRQKLNICQTNTGENNLWPRKKRFGKVHVRFWKVLVPELDCKKRFCGSCVFLTNSLFIEVLEKRFRLLKHYIIDFICFSREKTSTFMYVFISLNFFLEI